MGLIVQKYGGRLVENVAGLQQVASWIAQRHAAGDRILAVVSAMGDTTDQLFALARQISDDPPRRELDLLISVGERVSMTLLSMALHGQGVPAVSFTGSQSGIITDGSHTKARILDIRADRLAAELERGRVVVVAGFQGVSLDREVTTLGRGGSDMTAVALAAVLKADRCELYKDVDGIYTADPRYVSQARRILRLSFEEMLELASHGAGVLQWRAVEFAARHGVPLLVRSLDRSDGGTVIEPVGQDLERPAVRAVVLDRTGSWVRVRTPGGTGRWGELLEALGSGQGGLEGLFMSVDPDGTPVLLIGLPDEEANQLLGDLPAVVDGAPIEEDLAMVTVVGPGIRQDPGLTARLFSVLAQRGVDVVAVAAAGLHLSVLVSASGAEGLVNALHKEYGLEG